MDLHRTHWDPFGRVVPSQLHRVEWPALALRVPPRVKSVSAMVSVVSSVPMIVLAALGNPLMWWAAGLFAASIAVVLGLEILDRSDQRRFHAYMRLADRLGWSFRLAPVSVTGGPGLSGTRRRRAAGLDLPRGSMPGPIAEALERATAARRAAGTLSDTDASELLAVYRSIPELFRPRPGQPVAMTLEAEFWGETGRGTPFWMGARVAEMDTTFASRQLRRDLHGHAGDHGALLMMVAGYRLARDTGIRAALTAEMLGESRHDFKTESTAFNRRFHIAVRSGEGDPLEIETRLLQALTPATQTSLLDLWERYRLQVIIDGATVFVSGHERFNARDDAILSRLLPQAADAFATAAVRFGQYVE